MQLKSETLKHAAGGLSEVTAFGLDASSASVIIGMLTRQYSDPEMAFIRETSSNAYDAHIAAGNPEVPFDLHVPTSFAPHVEIRDYGTGLSKDFMLNKYTQVGHSTKRTSNAQIGGFGIGRLSFLIVTEQAAITSYYGGKKYSYTVNYDEAGQLLISLTDERETDEPNGLRLKFPVQVNRVAAFRNAARKYFSRVSSTLPNFLGEPLDIEPTNYSHKTERWGVRTNGDNNVIYAIMGNIAYPVQTDTLKYDTTFSSVRSLLDSRIDLFFDIGEVIPLPTRENLDMCEQTQKALLQSLTEVKAGLVAKLETRISSAANRWQAYRVWHEIYEASSYEFKRVLQDLDLNFNGERVRSMKFNHLNVMKTVPHPNASDDPDSPMFGKVAQAEQLLFHSRTTAGYNASRSTSWDRGYSQVGSTFDKYLRRVFIYNDVKHGIRPTIDYNFQNPDTLISLVSGPREAWDEFMAREISNGMNPKAFRYASKLLPKPRHVRVRPKNVQLDYVPGANRNAARYDLWKSYSRQADISVFDGKQYYVLASNYQVKQETVNLYRKYYNYVQLGLLEPVNVLVINKKNVPIIQDDWLPFEKYVKVSARLVARRKAQVREALYCALRRAHLNVRLTNEFATHRLVDSGRRYIEAIQERRNVKKDSPVGALLRANRDVFLAVEDMRWLVGKLTSRLEALSDSKGVEDFVSSVLKYDGFLNEEAYKALADSFELDYQAIRDTATVETRRDQLVTDYLASQVYFVVSILGHREDFDLQKLKKELTQ